MDGTSIHVTIWDFMVLLSSLASAHISYAGGFSAADFMFETRITSHAFGVMRLKLGPRQKKLSDEQLLL